MLEPPLDTPLDAMLGQRLLQAALDLLDVDAPLRGMPGDLPLDLAVGLRLEGGKGQILEFALDPADAEPVGERRIDVQGLLGNPALPVGRLMAGGCACCADGPPV